VKTKAKEAVASIFKFHHSNNPNVISSQRVQVEELKHEFTYTYRVRKCALLLCIMTLINMPAENWCSESRLYEEPCYSRHHQQNLVQEFHKELT
jgi:hypothetical protein